MNKYTCENHTPVRAENMNEAAAIFAGRKARAAYGRRAYARTLNKESYSQDGRLAPSPRRL